ncbi:hypothetical protein DNTS_008982 [Danionella cerebrum]|uniref:Uncharacterized protein n=1 Tax=Danionella cerebrum TaxID=2873325 RepID=A0A553Q4F9_9TELE|nr:hypothetical protein DNTS_008982 [Danionella translucida]
MEDSLLQCLLGRRSAFGIGTLGEGGRISKGDQRETQNLDLPVCLTATVHTEMVAVCSNTAAAGEAGVLLQTHLQAEPKGPKSSALSMADKQQIKATAVKVLGYVEKISSFASSIDPLFGIVTSVVGVIRKGLVDEEDHELDSDFKQIHEKLESISEKNKQTLRQIQIDEVNENYGKHEEIIKHQYGAFNTMLERVKMDSENSDRHMKEFQNIYEKDEMDMSLEVYYRGIKGSALFGRPILQVYLEHCQRNKKVMEARCSHIAHLFYIGLMALMAYYAVSEDDEDELRDRWGPRVTEIQAKMQEVLDQCTEEN